MVNLEAIENKKKHIEKQIEALKNNEQVIAKVGGTVSVNKQHEIDFQNVRLSYLENLKTMTEEEIIIEKDIIETSLPKEALNCKFGMMSGLDEETIQKIMKLEKIDIALGVM